MIPQCEILSVVVVEEEVVVNMVCSTIDEKYQAVRDTEVSIMYRNGPDVDKDKKWKVDHL